MYSFLKCYDDSDFSDLLDISRIKKTVNMTFYSYNVESVKLMLGQF